MEVRKTKFTCEHGHTDMWLYPTGKIRCHSCQEPLCVLSYLPEPDLVGDSTCSGNPIIFVLLQQEIRAGRVFIFDPKNRPAHISTVGISQTATVLFEKKFAAGVPHTKNTTPATQLFRLGFVQDILRRLLAGEGFDDALGVPGVKKTSRCSLPCRCRETLSQFLRGVRSTGTRAAGTKRNSNATTCCRRCTLLAS